MTVELRVIEDQAGAAEARMHVGGLLAAAFAGAPYNRPASDVEAMLARFDRHARKRGFRLVLAYDDARLVALAYGYTLPANTGWWKDTLESVPADVAAEDGSRSFAVFELAVDPARRREHLATRVHEALLTGRPEQRVVLNVRHDAKPAQGFYEAHGYQRAASAIPWQNAPVYDVMALDLR